MHDRNRRCSEADFAGRQCFAIAGIGSLQRFFDALDAQLAHQETVVASGFSIADITAVVTVDFARVVRVKPGEQHAALKRWREAMAQRPSMSL